MIADARYHVEAWHEVAVETMTCGIWSTKKHRDKCSRADPRIKRYGEVMGMERVIQRLAAEGGRFSLVLDLDLTLVETVKEEIYTSLSPDLQAQLLPLLLPLPAMRVFKRPGLDAFLQSLSAYYDLHLYSHGHPAYVQKVVALLDPQGSLFRNRVVAPLLSPNALVGKRLERVKSVEDKDLALVLDDQLEIWTADVCLLPSKVYSPSHSVAHKTKATLSTFSHKFDFEDIPSRLFLADSTDTQLSDLAQALITAYMNFVANGATTTACYELGEVRRSVLRNMPLSFSRYQRRISTHVRGYSKDRFKLYHFSACALGATVCGAGTEVVERPEGDGEVSGKWLVTCLLHLRKL